MIRLEEVSKHYADTVAVDGLSLQVNAGEVCMLIGPSGCGKTTTLRMINRLVEPSSGRILIDGVDNRHIKTEALRRSIGYAIQSVGLFPHMTVAANIAVVPELLHWSKARIAERAEELLALVGLDPAVHAGKYPAQLSGGEAQRVGVARALAADPPILLMDEPFGAVDPLTRDKLQDQFSRIQQTLKKTVIMVTHDLDEAIRLADRIAVMRAGRLVQYDTPEALLSKPANKFVHDFVGADKALKRLSRISVRGFIKPAPSVELRAASPNVSGAARHRPSTGSGHRWLWVVDGGRRLIGWLDMKDLAEGQSIADAMVRTDAEEIAVGGDATLREALSRMLGQGFRYIPVVDDDHRLLGELGLADIEKATSEG